MAEMGRLESAADAIERRVKACPDNRYQLALARMLAIGLDDGDWKRRTENREKMLTLGKAALPALLHALRDKKNHVRWHAAKALSEVHDPETAPDLINAMEDKDFGVRWLAAEGLIAMGADILEPLLRGLRLRFHSHRMLEGTRHVLHVLADDGVGGETVKDLLHVLQKSGSPEEVAWAAERAWEGMRAKPGRSS
ncbi:MAG: HEAT repeat domain-containing protein [Anaerolineales bacterium]